jgi:DNA-binding NtrC family response regulator
VIRFPLTPDEAAVAAYVVGLVRALTETSGNIREAARGLDMSEHTLRHRLKELDLVTWNQRAHPLGGRRTEKGGTKG